MGIARFQSFFFYGTLIGGSTNSTARAVHRRLHPIGPGSVPGALWAIPDPAGWYPALLTGAGQVHGVAYRPTDEFGCEDLTELDKWEDFRSDVPTASLYLRKTMPVTDATGISHLAQVYRYNQPLPPDARIIPGGDFRAWLKANRFTAYTR